MYPGKCIDDDIFFARFVQDFAVVIGGSFHPTKLSLIEIWLSLEIDKGAMIGVNFKVSS
jgi:hypothetical protein